MWTNSCRHGRVSALKVGCRGLGAYVFIYTLIACGLVGAHVLWSKEAFSAINQFEARGEHAIIGYKERFGPLTAALLNGTFIQACELDDYHSLAPLHSNSVLLPALFAAAQACKSHPTDPRAVNGADFILAPIVGCETGPRAGVALNGGEMLSKGWHSGPIFGAPAAAAASAKLWGLSAVQIEDAGGIACTQACELMAAQYEGMVKRMQHAFAARNGLLGALLAKGGYQGIRKVFERPYRGYLAMFGLGSKHDPAYDPLEVSRDLGKYWHTEVIRVKLHTCVGGCYGLIEFTPQNLVKITSIHVRLSEPIFHHDGWVPEVRPLTATGGQMNAAYIAAVQLVDRQVLLKQFANSQLDRNEVWDIMHKVRCSHSAEFDAPNMGCGARVTVAFDDGTSTEDFIMQPKGFDPPVSNGEIRSNERQRKIEDLVRDLEHLKDITDLTNLLSGAVANPQA
ncbi:hypothetical protein BDR22DRAFT_901012 [Usnea florida]